MCVDVLPPLGAGDALFGAIIRVPAVAVVLLVLLAIFVLYHQVGAWRTDQLVMSALRSDCAAVQH
jgi:hypothetical protein